MRMSEVAGFESSVVFTEFARNEHVRKLKL